MSIIQKYCLFLILFLTVANVIQAKDTTNYNIYQFDIKEQIAPPVWKKTKKAIEKAHENNADLIFIHMNTYGGLVDAADSIRTKILNSKIPVYILIENNAASAGALISIACDSIYMMPGSTIGAATVVDQSGKPVPDKYQSYMRKKMRATAEQNGRNPDIAEAMVDPDKVVPGVSDSGKVVTFTTKEAIQHGFCEAEARSIHEALSRSKIKDYNVVRHRETVIDKIIGILVSPMISSILVMIIIGGIYFELQSPGIGFPIAAAAIAATLYFAPLYLEGLAANWEILIFLLGIVLLAVEIFAIPGFGVAGIGGITLMITGLALSLIGNVGIDPVTFNTEAVVKAFFMVIISTIISIAGSIFIGARFIQSKLFQHLVLNAILGSQQENNKSESPSKANGSTVHKEDELVGKKGKARTMLRPSGKVEIDEEIYDATAETGFIDAGDLIEVVRYETAQLVVQKVS